MFSDCGLDFRLCSSSDDGTLLASADGCCLESISLKASLSRITSLFKLLYLSFLLFAFSLSDSTSAFLF